MNKVEVHSFTIGDCDDPEIYAAHPLIEWEKTEMGQWVKDKSVTQPEFHIGPCLKTFGYRVRITADLEDQDLTYFCLRWADIKDYS